MIRLTLATLAFATIGLFVLAPGKSGFAQQSVRIGDGLQSPPSSSNCRTEQTWSRDYSGRPYLRKVRVCA